MRRLVPLLTVLVLVLPGSVFGQRAEQPQAQSQAQGLDPAKMGVSMERIRRELVVEQYREVRSGTPLKLEYRVDVIGQAPRIDFFTNFPLDVGPVPNSAPSHSEFLQMVTPQQFRSPPFPISSLAIWAAQKLAEKSAKARCEDELRAYRELVMQGVQVAAPRCTQ